ncbi:MAG: hypothetical protein WKF47_18085 [Geodermatophilaceae bacterium]
MQRTVPHPFVVTGLGGAAVRLGVERECENEAGHRRSVPLPSICSCSAAPRRRTWTLYWTGCWDQLARPRARADLRTPEGVGPGMDRAMEQLTDIDLQRADVDPPELDSGHNGGETSDADRPSPAAGQPRECTPATPECTAAIQAHTAATWACVAATWTWSRRVGLVMADRGPGRDGLIHDRLHMPLGPALPDWPAGLVLRLVLQGDVVQEVTVEVIGTAAGSYWDVPPTAPARHWQAAGRLDILQRLLSVAGWPAAAMTGRRLRDDLLAGVAPESIGAVWSSWDRRVCRSRTLRWSTDRVGVRRDGDVTARLVRWLDIAAAAWTGHSPPEFR